MKLAKIKIRNFRCYREEFVMTFDELTCIIARNDAGKSTVLEALDAFFNLDKIDSEDRSIEVPTGTPVEITCVFSELQPQIVVDTDAIISPQGEYLLNADGQLEIRKSYSGASPKCEQVYVTALHPSVENFNDLFNLSIVQLRQRARTLGVQLDGINQTIKSAIRNAIWDSVNSEALGLSEVQLEIKETIWKSLQNSLPLYQLFRADRPSTDQDAEAQDPLKFAIKEALADQQQALDAIGAQVKAQVETVTRATIDKIREMDPALAAELNPVFSALNWSKVFSVSLTAENQVPLNKRGSGVRRLFLINFFRAKAEQLASGRGAPDVILAIEEPETSQHPSNQLLLLEALLDLAESPSTQIIMTTHNPLLARKINQDRIRFIEIDQHLIRSVATNDEAATLRLKDTLGILPNHDVKVFVGVEGPNDIEFLKRISAILSAVESDIPNLTLAEQSGLLVFIPMGGSTLEIWTNRLQGLAIPEVHIMDRDNPPPQQPKYHVAAAAVNARAPHAQAFTTNFKEMENYLHCDAISAEFGIVMPQIQPFDDVPEIVAELLHTAAATATPWASLDGENRSRKCSKAKRRLNRAAVDLMTAQLLTATDTNDEVRTWLRAIGQRLL